MEGMPRPPTINREIGSRGADRERNATQTRNPRGTRSIPAGELGRSRPSHPAVIRPGSIIHSTRGGLEVAADRDPVPRIPELDGKHASGGTARDRTIRDLPLVPVGAAENPARIDAPRRRVPPAALRRDARPAGGEPELAIQGGRQARRIDDVPARAAVAGLDEPELAADGIADGQAVRVVFALEVHAVVESGVLPARESQGPGGTTVARVVDARLGARSDGEDHGAVRRPRLHVAELELGVLGRQRGADRRPAETTVCGAQDRAVRPGHPGDLVRHGREAPELLRAARG